MQSSDRGATNESESVVLTQCRRLVHLEAYTVEGSAYVVFSLSDGTTDEITAEQALEIGRLGTVSIRMAERELVEEELFNFGGLPEGGAAA